MIVQSTSALPFANAAARLPSARQTPAASPANIADTVRISQAAREALAASPSSSATNNDKSVEARLAENAASPQFNFNITDISANTLANVGNELHSKGQINAETHLMMTLPRLGSAAMHVGGLPSDTRVLGGHIEDPRKNIDMLQYAKDKLNYIEMVNEKYPLQKVDTKPWEQFISTLEQLDGKGISQGVDLTA